MPRRLHWFAVVSLTSIAVAVSSAWVWPLWSSDPRVAIPTVLFSGALIAAGAILQSEPGQTPAAVALLLAGCLWPLSWVEISVSGGPWPLIARVVSPLALVLTAWAIYRYPDPGQVGAWERWFLRSLSLWIVVGRTAVIITSLPAWQDLPVSSWWPTIYADQGLNQVLAFVSSGGEALLGVTFLVQWYWRIRRVRGLDRRLMGPVVVAALVSGSVSALVPLARVAGLPTPDLYLVFAVQATLLLSVPVAFAVAALRRRLISTVIADMAAQLRGEPTPENVEQAFRQALADPGLRVYYWSEDLECHLDRDGLTEWSAPFDESAAGPSIHDLKGTHSLLLPVTTAADEPLALIRADQALARYPDLVAAAVSVGALAVQNARLQVATRAQLAQVRASHTRIIEAGLAERQALERGLHTGALTRILGLVDYLSDEQNLALPQLRDIVHYATDQLCQVADELQDIGSGLHPSILSQAGLLEAVSRMSQAQPVPVAVDLPRRRFPVSVEVAAYYVISEAVTNAIRHAQATRITIAGVDLGQSLRVTIKDDGQGGADVALGTGLIGLRERLQALDGDLSLISPRGAGTTLMVEIPC